MGGRTLASSNFLLSPQQTCRISENLFESKSHRGMQKVAHIHSRTQKQLNVSRQVQQLMSTQPSI